MIEPTGYTALDLIGFTDRGAYDPTANYVKNDIVTVGNTKWRCKVDDTTGVTPAENANWTIYLESATSLAGMSDVTLTSPKNGDGLVHDGNDWKNIPIMTQAMQTKLGAKNKARITATTQTVDGITYTIDQSAGTVIASGSLAAGKTSSYLAIGKVSVVAGDILTGCPVGGGSSDYELVVFNSSQTARIATDIGNGVVATSTDANAVIGIYIRKNLSSAIRFEPMVRIAEFTDRTFVPHAKTNRELTEDVAIEDISSGVSYASGVTGTDVTFDVKRIGKLVIFTFMISTGSLMPTAGWGATQILTGLPKSSSADRARISGATLTNKIPFAVVVNASGLCTIVKLQGGASTDTLPPYFGGVITYIEQ